MPRAELQNLGTLATVCNVSIPDMMADAASSFGKILATSGSATDVLKGYRMSLGLPLLQPPPTAAIEGSPKGLSSAELAAAIAGPVGVSLLLAAAVVFVWYMRLGRLKHLVSHKGVPGAGPGTTLLVSDIEGRCGTVHQHAYNTYQSFAHACFEGGGEY